MQGKSSLPTADKIIPHPVKTYPYTLIHNVLPAEASGSTIVKLVRIAAATPKKTATPTSKIFLSPVWQYRYDREENKRNNRPTYCSGLARPSSLVWSVAASGLYWPWWKNDNHGNLRRYREDRIFRLISEYVFRLWVGIRQAIRFIYLTPITLALCPTKHSLSAREGSSLTVCRRCFLMQFWFSLIDRSYSTNLRRGRESAKKWIPLNR